MIIKRSLFVFILAQAFYSSTILVFQTHTTGDLILLSHSTFTIKQIIHQQRISSFLPVRCETILERQHHPALNIHVWLHSQSRWLSNYRQNMWKPSRLSKHINKGFGEIVASSCFMLCASGKHTVRPSAPSTVEKDAATLMDQWKTERWEVYFIMITFFVFSQ